MNSFVETISSNSHSCGPKIFRFKQGLPHSDSPSAGEAGELCWKITRQRMSSRRRSMCGRLWPDSRSTLVGPATRRGKRGSLFERATPKVKGRETDVRVLFAREIFTRFLAVAKLLKRMVARDGIEPPTPVFSGCGSTVVIYIPNCADGLHLRCWAALSFSIAGTFEEGVAKVTLSVVPGSGSDGWLRLFDA